MVQSEPVRQLSSHSRHTRLVHSARLALGVAGASSVPGTASQLAENPESSAETRRVHWQKVSKRAANSDLQS